MLDIYSGHTFRVPRGDTRRLDVESYMKQMGVIEDPEAVEYTPEDFLDDPAQMDTREGAQYESAMKRLNMLGIAAAAKNIDVFSPDPRHPQSMGVAQEYQSQLNKVRRLANDLVAGHELSKLAITEQLKGQRAGITMPQSGGNVLRASDFADARNIPQTVKPLLDYALKAAKEIYQDYDNPAMRDQAEIRRRGVRGKILDWKPQLIAQGLTEQEADTAIQSALAYLDGEVTYDKLDEQYKRAQIAAKNRSNTGSGGKDDDLNAGAQLFYNLRKAYKSLGEVPIGTDDPLNDLGDYQVQKNEALAQFQNLLIGEKLPDGRAVIEVNFDVNGRPVAVIGKQGDRSVKTETRVIDLNLIRSLLFDDDTLFKQFVQTAERENALKDGALNFSFGGDSKQPQENKTSLSDI